MKKPKVHATNDQSIDINELLKKHLVVKSQGDKALGTPTIVAYRDGWDDERVAKTVDENLSFKSVSKIRAKRYGLLQPAPGSINVNGAAHPAGFDMLVEEFHALRSLVGQVIENHNRLCMSTGNGPYAVMLNGTVPGIDKPAAA